MNNLDRSEPTAPLAMVKRYWRALHSPPPPIEPMDEFLEDSRFGFIAVYAIACILVGVWALAEWMI